MIRFFILCFIFPFFVTAQSDDALTKMYEQAIGDFIREANKHNKARFDTLYFGKRVNLDEDNFPDIQLPKTIKNTQIRLISPEQGEKNQKQKPSRIYINLFGWLNKESAQFFFVVFSNGFAHQYDYKLYYKYNGTNTDIKLDKVEFIPQPGKK